MPPRVLHDAKEAIQALGGVVHVAKLCGVNRNAVSNWYTRGFPPERYEMLGGLLRAAGFKFHPSLFKQHELAQPREKNGGKR